MYKKKSLGQHFLTSTHYVRLIADAGSVAKNDTVLEIGPGGGILTQELLSRGATVVAVEKDARLIPLLQEKFAQEIKEKRFFLHEGDALEINISQLKLGKSYKLVANIPYYITGALLRKFLSEKKQPSLLVFLIQKEVAERIARSKKESILSLAVKVYGAPKYIKTVPAGAFSPAPDVDSAILLVENISRDNFKNATHEERFFEIVRAGFAQKRKLLKRNIESVIGKNAAELLTSVDITENARAEDVLLEKWVKLSSD